MGAKEKERPLNVIALDRSGSTEAMREEQKATLTAAVARAARFGEDVSIYVVDNKAACVLPPTRARKGQQPLTPSVIRELDTPSKERATRTRPALLWEEMAEEYAAGDGDGGRKVRILYLTDGGNDWYGEEARVAGAAQKLAGNPNVSVGLVGLHKDTYESVTKQFAPFSDGRSVFTVGGDRRAMIQGLAELRQKGAAAK